MDPNAIKQFAPYIMPLLIGVLIVRRSARARKVSIARMWLMPVIFGCLVVLALVAEPVPPPVGIAAFTAAAGFGALFGYFTARHTHLSVDDATGTLTARATPVGTALLLILFALRFGLRQIFPPPAGDGSHMDETVMIATNALLIFSVAMMLVRAHFVRARARPLLNARSEPAAPTLRQD